MVKIDIFEALLEYHLEYNLPKWLKHAKIDGDNIVPKDKDVSLEEGIDENPYTKGFLVFENGDTLIDRLKKDNIVIDNEIPPWAYMNNKEGFIEYINGCGSKISRESAYVVDAKNNKATRVREFNNSIKNGIDYKQFLPRNFLSKGEKEKVDINEIGLKTRNAIRLPTAYEEVTSYQIKATPYANAGMGVVAEYGTQGLKRTVHMEYKPEEDLPYVNKEFKIVAIERKYEKKNNEVVCISERYLDMNSILNKSKENKYKKDSQPHKVCYAH